MMTTSFPAAPPRRVSLDGKRLSDTWNEQQPAAKRRRNELDQILQACGADASTGAMALRQLYSHFLYNDGLILPEEVLEKGGHAVIVRAMHCHVQSVDFQIISMSVLFRLAEDASLEALWEAGCMEATKAALWQHADNATLCTVALRLLDKLMDKNGQVQGLYPLLNACLHCLQRHPEEKALLLNGCRLLGKLCGCCHQRTVIEQSGATQVLRGILQKQCDAKEEHYQVAHSLLLAIQTMSW